MDKELIRYFSKGEERLERFENLENVDSEIIRNLSLFRKNLHYLRKKINKQTLDEVASVIGISKDSLFKLESDEDRFPTLKTVLKLCYFYGVPIDGLVYRDLEIEESKLLSEIKYVERGEESDVITGI